jgi:hypothetical protein
VLDVPAVEHDAEGEIPRPHVQACLAGGDVRGHWDPVPTVSAPRHRARDSVPVGSRVAFTASVPGGTLFGSSVAAVTLRAADACQSQLGLKRPAYPTVRASVLKAHHIRV